MAVEKLQYFVNGQFKDSKTDTWYDLHNPSTGEVTGQAPCCTNDEVLEAIAAAKAAYPGWRAVPAIKRAQILYKIRDLIMENMEELTMSVAKENGKVWSEAEGDVLKAKEGTELATQVPSLMMGESMMDASTGYDTVKYREPIGVFAGIVPVNFPAMIPFSWMAPTCIACGNTMVLKAASLTPKTAMLFAKIYKEAGVPDGVINVVTCSRNEINTILDHPDVKGITFVGSTPVGLKFISVPLRRANAARRFARRKTTRWLWRTPRSKEPLPASLTPLTAAPVSAAWRFPAVWLKKRLPTNL